MGSQTASAGSSYWLLKSGGENNQNINDWIYKKYDINNMKKNLVTNFMKHPESGMGGNPNKHRWHFGIQHWNRAFAGDGYWVVWILCRRFMFTHKIGSMEDMEERGERERHGGRTMEDDTRSSNT